MPNASCSPATVPTSVSWGRSGSTGVDADGGGTVGAATTAGGGGRREGEKIGRPRVAARVLSGMAQSGLPRALSPACLDEAVSAPPAWGSAPIGSLRVGAIAAAMLIMTRPTGRARESLSEIISHLATGRRPSAARAADLLVRPIRQPGLGLQAARQRGMACRLPDHTGAAGGPADRARSWR